jgi:hypothetical protein
MFTARLRNYQKWCLPQRTAFAWLSMRKQIHAPVFSGPWENGFVRTRILQHQYRRGVATLKTKDSSVRRNTVSALVWVKRLCGTLRPLSVEVQEGKPWVTDAEFYADGFPWNLTRPRYQTVGLGELELQMKSGWSGLLALLISLHMTSFCGVM